MDIETKVLTMGFLNSSGSTDVDFSISPHANDGRPQEGIESK